MASSTVRRPLPALVALVALLALSAIVWWRVLNRGDDTGAAAKPCPSPTPTATATLPAPQSVTIRVLNSTTRSGIAATARQQLAGYGFNSPSPAGNDGKKYRNKIKGVAQIRYGSRGTTAAHLLQYYVPGAQLLPVRSATSATVTLSLGQKYRKIAPATSVDKTLARRRIAVASPPPTISTTAPRTGTPTRSATSPGASAPASGTPAGAGSSSTC